MDDYALSEVTTLGRPCGSCARRIQPAPMSYDLIRFIALVLVPRLRPKLRPSGRLSVGQRRKLRPNGSPYVELRPQRDALKLRHKRGRNWLTNCALWA